MDGPFLGRDIDEETGRSLDGAVEAGAEGAFGFLERLVAAPSIVGHEQEAQAIVADELGRLGLAVESLPIPDTIGSDPLAGAPATSHVGRSNVVGRSGQGELALLNGHIDVVPAEPAAWRTSPWRAERRGGWLHGRGAACRPEGALQRQRRHRAGG